MRASIWTLALLFIGSCSFDTGGLAGNDGDVDPPADADHTTIDADVTLVDADVTVVDADVTLVDAAIPDAELPPDAAIPPDADLHCGWPYDPTHFDPCSIPVVPATLNVSASGMYFYDTDTGTLTDPSMSISNPPSSSSGGVRILWTNSFTVGNDAVLRVLGDQPLMVVSTGDISMQGIITAASVYQGDDYYPGAGANPEVCPASPPDPGQTCAQHGGSGGGAGAFGANGGSGGEGGDGHTCVTDGIPGGAGGVALAAPPASIRGGCAGRDGAPNNSGDGGFGPGGPGGGAVQLTAKGTLTVAGIMHASGAGGRPGFDNRSAGGAGGSGGMLGLEANTITITASATLAANGGGGGGGCNDGEATPGEDGKPSAQVANGGARQETGGDGGNGGYKTVPAGEAGDGAERGGGGGGGSVGFIIINAHSMLNSEVAATISPTATIL